MRKVFVSLMAAAFVLAMAGGAFAQVTQNLTINATIGARAQLEFSTYAIAFNAEDPDTMPMITSVPATVTVTARLQTAKGANVSLTCQANKNLTTVGDTDTIAISNVTWTGFGAGFALSGTMSTAAPQAVAQWIGSGYRTGELSFFMANSWNYGAGSYGATVTYTLSVV